MKLTLLVAGAAAAFGLGATAVSAAPLVVTSYDMQNGDGHASGGTYDYWDATYTGSGATTTDHAPLSGGLGVLTDGYASPDPGPLRNWRIVIH